ncbi:MAG TPA: head GIN domain-containing protein [Balneolales bacterium]|nr:head GIN domain-containing protein [Balneolales bacterium]
MSRKILFVLMGGLLLFLASCGTFSSVEGNGNIVTTSRDIPEVANISFGGSYKVIIQNGPSSKVILKGDENILPLIHTDVQGNELKITTDHHSINPSQQIVINITVPNIEEIDASGSNEISLKNITTDYLEVHVSGSNRLTATGSAKTFKLDGSGSSRVNAQNLKADVVDVSMSGSTHSVVSASKGLKTKISGSGKLIVYGHPDHTDMHTSGSASVTMK